ncbi:MAG TPA: SIS domain-containing protein [Candidatus Saccharimonadales bacterium]|nr:SIS domain-containing protein [Candidatus Saccharimonadales bacterium]
MLDDINVLKQRDRSGALAVVADIYRQTALEVNLVDSEHDDRVINNIVVAGMGGSALAAEMAKVILHDSLTVPFEIVRGYELPNYTHENTLVIASSFSGSTEETVACFEAAIKKSCQVVAITSGGKLKDLATNNHVMLGLIPEESEARYGMIYNLRILLRVLVEFGLASKNVYDEMTQCEPWLHQESELWDKDVPIEHNYAKQLALLAVGKTPVFYAGPLMAPVAYKWKISWNENAKNVSVSNILPEFSHNEFAGWTSHPIEKPFAVFDLVSELENPRILKRFNISDRLLSGRRPKATVVPIAGKGVMEQLLWGCILGEFVSVYVAILNNVDPTGLEIIDKLKKELG